MRKSKCIFKKCLYPVPVTKDQIHDLILIFYIQHTCTALKMCSKLLPVITSLQELVDSGLQYWYWNVEK